MDTKTIVAVVVVFVVGAGVWYWISQGATPAPSAMTDQKNATYTIDGQSVTFVKGRAETPITPGSVSKVVTQYFGNEATGDLNGDGIADIAFILTQNQGGSGTFYYVAAAIKTTTGYTGTDAVLLGDRIAPQTTLIQDGKLIVNYADRLAGEPMTTQPSVRKSLYLKLDPTTLQFGIIDQKFSGEADPSKMTLTMQTWTWMNTLYSDGTTIVPKKSKAFTITFTKDPLSKTGNSFSATTDCNSVAGTYSMMGSKIYFSKMVSTMMACMGSQESDFTKSLAAAQSYHFTSKGELIFDLKMDSGTMTFR